MTTLVGFYFKRFSKKSLPVAWPLIPFPSGAMAPLALMAATVLSPWEVAHGNMHGICLASSN